MKYYRATEWLNETGGELVYRGFTISNSESTIKIIPPSDRLPRNISKSDQIILDNWFEAKFGIRFRQCSVFCTGDIEIATHYCEDYGEVRSIEAEGEFIYCWSPNTTDLYNDVALFTGDNLHDLLESLDYRCYGLQDALISGNEIMFTGESFAAKKLNE